MFSVVAINQGLFPFSRIQLMSRCARGSTATQIAELANGNIPYHRHPAHFTNGLGQGQGFVGFSQNHRM